MMKNKLLSIILSVSLSACGFHLRGIGDIPEWLNNVAVITKDSDPKIAHLLESQLTSYHIKISESPEQAKYWLVVTKSNIAKQVISIGASTNQRQYQLIMTVQFLLQTPKGDVLKKPMAVIVNRQLTVNNDRILGSNEEEELLVTEMRQDAVIQILNRLSYKNNHHGNT